MLWDSKYCFSMRLSTSRYGVASAMRLRPSARSASIIAAEVATTGQPVMALISAVCFASPSAPARNEPLVQAYATTLGLVEATRREADATSVFMARRPSGVVSRSITRAEWNEKPSGARRANSGSIVVLTDGMMSPMRTAPRLGFRAIPAMAPGSLVVGDVASLALAEHDERAQQID